MAAWCFVLVLCALCATEAQVPGFGKKRETIPLLREDIKFIQCEMCEKVSKHLHRTVNRMREALPKWDKLTEAAIFDQLEVMCDPAKDAGEWISHLDIQEDGDRLRVVEMTGVRTTMCAEDPSVLFACHVLVCCSTSSEQ